jgi:RNA polymerase sigma-70 factor (ECF subfamily)
MTEQALIAGCVRKEVSAQRALYDQYSPKMLAVCSRYALNREDAEDMLQEGFIKIFLQIKSYEGRGSFEGWIRRIVVHTCINHLKKYKKFQENLDLVHAHGLPTRSESIPSIVQAKQVSECIRQLPVGYRTVLNLYAIEGYSHREIAQILDIEESTSRSQYTRAKNLLESILIQRNILPPHKQKIEWLAAAR